ncbi:2OG-Fe(II)-dependent halogenase WelO5 family protein [Streptomyces parvulus]|uniref:2OG-Fe(II)-dependent halogenase WelO5 family protein n=1 Tax=Streptomyces parvulus TaxID=146923 RepID=UPI0037F19293
MTSDSLITSTQVRDPFFRVVTATGFTRHHIADLVAGRCAAVQVPGLFAEAVCGDLVHALSGADFDQYGAERVQPAVMRFGVGVSDYRSDGRVDAEYWPALDRARAAWDGLSLPMDPWEEARRSVGADWPGRVGVGRHEGREMGAGVAREAPQGFLVHYDDSAREFTDQLLEAPLLAQLAFNLYLAVPESGGETVIWRHRWHPRDEEFRPQGSYGFTGDCVRDVESIEIRAAVGDGLLFDSRNYHAVKPSRGGRRIALGFSVGVAVTGELLAWG